MDEVTLIASGTVDELTEDRLANVYLEHRLTRGGRLALLARTGRIELIATRIFRTPGGVLGGLAEVRRAPRISCDWQLVKANSDQPTGIAA